MSKEWRKERFCGLGTRLALEIRDQFPAVQQTNFEQTANFRGLRLQRGLIILLFSHLPSCFCRNWTLEGCFPWVCSIGPVVGSHLLSEGDSCIAFTSDSCRSRTKFVTHSKGFINWCLIGFMQHKWNKILCGCYYPFPFQGKGTEFLDNDGLSFVSPIPWVRLWPCLMVLTAPWPLAAAEQPVGLPQLWSCPSCPEVSSWLGTPCCCWRQECSQCPVVITFLVPLCCTAASVGLLDFLHFMQALL